MRLKTVTVSTLYISLLVVVLLFFSLTPFSSISLRSAEASPPTAISPTDGTGSPASLGTIITSGISHVPTDLCTANCVITGGTSAGHNLYHSLGDFNIGASDSARFQTGLFGPQPDASVLNILARVTGGPSNLFGNLDSATYYPSANLFLINPAGFLFGPNATVNVGGMVAFTSADYLRLGELGTSNAGIFHADLAQTNILTNAPVVSFGFLGSNPGAITVQGGQFSVTDGQGISLVGGNVTVQSGTPDGGTAQPAHLSIPNGKIQLASVASPGEFDAETLQPLPNVNSASFTSFGSITLASGSNINVSGTNTVSIRGGQFVLSVNDAVLTTSQTPGLPETISLSPGSSIVTSNSGTDPGTDVQLIASNVQMDGASIITSPAEGSFGKGGDVTIFVTGSASFTDSTIQTAAADFSSAGSAGAVSVTANDSLEMINTTINARALFANGNAGPVTLKTNGSLSLTDSFISTQASAPGNGGTVTITGKDVTLNDSSILTFIFGNDDPALGLVHPGSVTITAENTVTVSGSLFGDPEIPVISASATGTLVDAGPVTIAGKTVNLSNGTIDVSMQEGQISSPGNSGAIEIRGNNVNLSQFTLISQNAGQTGSTGKGGNILLRGTDNLRADNISLTNSAITVDSVSSGGAGNIEFKTQALTLSDTRVRADTAGIGPGGSIAVHGAQTVTLQSNSLISGSALNSDTPGGFPGPFGSAGNILFETQKLTMQGGSALRAADLPLSQGNAGSITVRGTNNGPAQSILIDGTGSGIFTDAEGNGAGGNVLLNANSVTLQNSGTLSAKTSGSEATAIGGTITVTATNQVTMTGNALISTSSTGAGNAGHIHINAGQQLDMRDSSIKTEAAHASGGNIDIQAVNRVRLVNSTISTSVLGESGSGGNISIDPNVVVLQNSQVTAQAVNGAGGNITITTPLFLADQTSLVSASSEFGLNGTVTIQNPTSNLSESLGPLPSSMLEQQALQAQRCAALHGGVSSSFVIGGRDTVPTEPGGWLASSLGFHSLGRSLLADTMIDEQPPTTLVMTEASESISLRRLTPIGFLTQRFAGNGSDGCRS